MLENIYGAQVLVGWNELLEMGIYSAENLGKASAWKELEK